MKERNIREEERRGKVEIEDRSSGTEEAQEGEKRRMKEK